jgi:tellurite resistance protein TehA-like permease
MNNLSWFLYLAEVVPSFGGLLVGFGVATLIAYAGMVFTTGMNNDVYEKKNPYPSLKLPLIGASLCTLAALIPSKQTIYLIAGSEAGQHVVETESGQAILDDVQEIIQLQLNQMKGTTDDE